eukprot:3936514-Rhodomonas_salina.2
MSGAHSGCVSARSNKTDKAVLSAKKDSLSDVAEKPALPIFLVNSRRPRYERPGCCTGTDAAHCGARLAALYCALCRGRLSSWGSLWFALWCAALSTYACDVRSLVLIERMGLPGYPPVQAADASRGHAWRG